MAEVLIYGQYVTAVPCEVDTDPGMDQPWMLEQYRLDAQCKIERNGDELLPGPCQRREISDYRFDATASTVFYVWPVARVVEHG